VRVCFDGRGLDGRLTGAGKAFAFLLRRLRGDFPQHEFVPVMPRRPGGWRLPRQLWWEQVELPRAARRLGADVLHVAGGTSAPLAPRGRVVLTVHDLAPTRHPEYLPGVRSRWYWGRLVPFTARRAARVIAPSAATARDLVEVARVRPERVRVVPFAVPLEPAAPPPPAAVAAARAAHGLPERYLLYAGTIDRRKDCPTLLAALGHLDPALTLVVAGTVIEGRTDFRERLARLGLGARVRVLGYVPEGDLPGLYAGASALVYPSFFEGFGLPVLEAMACGTPVVTYRTTSLPEVAGDAAVLLDPPVTPEALAAAVARVVGDPALRADLIGRGRAQASRFDWGRTARLTLAVYEELCGSSS
jgi:glycosyltransferase involved in cell wall biosynthesis